MADNNEDGGAAATVTRDLPELTVEEPEPKIVYGEANMIIDVTTPED